MAKYINTDPFQERNDSRAFLIELQQFHQSRGAPFRRPPIINGIELDLLRLYNEVTSIGGWNKVIDQHKWEEILEKLGLPRNCANGSILLKHIYIRYLDKYERIHFHGEENEEISAESRSSRKSQISITSMVPTIYNHHQHEVTDQMRNMVGMALDRYVPSGYEKLCLSLLSNLPNEVDVALNIITIMSSDSKNGIQLSKAPKLIDLLLAQAGVYSEADKGLQEIIEESWDTLAGGKLSEFWMDTIDSADVELAQILNDNVCRDGQSEKMLEECDEDLFSVDRNFGCHDREGQRVLRIALILKNFSFKANNVPVLAVNSRFLRFLLLCTHCKWSELRTVAYDTLGNVSQEIVFRTADNSIKSLVLRIAVEAVKSHDRFLVMRGLEILAKLCQSEGNDEAIFQTLNNEVYEILCSYLTVQDVCLLVHTLEALYQLTELGEESCTGIATIHRSMEVLMNLLTVDPHLYGKDAMQGFKLVTLSDPTSRNDVSHPQTGQSISTPSTTPQRASAPTVLANMGTKQIMPNIQKLGCKFIVPAGYVQSNPAPITEKDPESYACQWLRTYFDVDSGCYVSKQELYNDFKSYATRSGHKSGFINQTNFLNCVRVVFPKSVEKKVESKNSDVFICYEGIKRKPIPSLLQFPLTVALPPSPSKTPPPVAGSSHSPILKAHLSAPTKCPSSPTSSPSKSQGIVTTPKSALSSSKVKDANNTTLIKSLLANKVNRNIHQKQLLQYEPDPSFNASTDTIDQSQTTPKSKSKLTLNKKFKDSPVMKSKATVLLAAKLNGVQKSIPVKIEEIKNLDPTPNKINGVAAEEEIPNAGCDKLIRSITAGLPVVKNEELELKRREKICKSSPLLNGLLDGKGKVSLPFDDNMETKLTSKEPKKVNFLQNGDSAEQSSDSSVVEDNKLSGTRGTENGLSNSGDNCVPKNTKDCKMKVSVPVAIMPKSKVEQYPDSNSTNSDLSSLSEIARTVESASVVINQSSAAANASVSVAHQEKQIETLKFIQPNINKQIINNVTSTVAIPIVTAANVTSQACIQFVPVFSPQSKIQIISQNNVSVCLNIIQPTNAEPINISNSKAVPSLKRPIVPSNIAPSSEIKKGRLDCSNIIKLEPTSDDKGVIIIENGVLQSKEEVTLQTGNQNVIPDANKTNNVNIAKDVADPTKSVNGNKTIDNGTKKLSDDKKKKPTNDVNKLEYTCEWQGCGQTFETPVAVYLHACEVHTPLITASNSIPCLWDKCDKQPRKRLSLMTHLQDRHCNEQILKINALRKQQIAKTGKTTIALPQNPPAHPGYPPNAAFHAIRRHALQFVCASDVVSEKNEDFLAKSVRLSSALILRNLCRYSSLGKKHLKQYESKLSLLALSKVEASNALAECLAALASSENR